MCERVGDAHAVCTRLLNSVQWGSKKNFFFIDFITYKPFDRGIRCAFTYCNEQWIAYVFTCACLYVCL